MNNVVEIDLSENFSENEHGGEKIVLYQFKELLRNEKTLSSEYYIVILEMWFAVYSKVCYRAFALYRQT